MDVKELKIGNWLTSSQWGGFFQLEGIEKTKKGFDLKIKGYVHSYIKGEYFDIQPIPLTEEILILNCNFNKDYKHGFIGIEVEMNDGMTIDFILVEPFSMGKWQNFYAFLYDNYKFCKLEYLHDLENLFYDLYKKELEITI